MKNQAVVDLPENIDPLEEGIFITNESKFNRSYL